MIPLRLPVLGLLLAACGASTTPTSTNANAPRVAAAPAEPEPSGDAPAVSACVADTSFTFSLAWPTPLHADALQLHTCGFAPADGAGERLPWIVTVDVRDRGGSTPEPLDVEGATIVDRGELDALGTRVPWVAIDDDTPWTGPGRMVLAQVSLLHHDVILGIVTAAGAPPDLEPQLRAALGMLTLRAASARDGVVLDPARSVCGGDDGQPLLALPIPSGARTDDTFVGECVALVGDDIDDPAWLLMVHVVTAGEYGAGALDAEPDGALRYLADAAGIPAPVDHGTVRWLGSETPWYAIERTFDGVPRIVVVSRVRVGTAIVLAVANVAPSERAAIPTVLAALEGVRRVD